MDAPQKFHQGTRIPLNTLYPDPDTQTFADKRVSLVNDVKGVMIHALVGTLTVAVPVARHVARVPTPVILGTLVGTSACIAFSPALAPAACCILTLPALPALTGSRFHPGQPLWYPAHVHHWWIFADQTGRALLPKTKWPCSMNPPSVGCCGELLTLAYST